MASSLSDLQTPSHLKKVPPPESFRSTDRTNKVMIGYGNQLVRTTKSNRLPEKEQFSLEAIEGLRGLLPWAAERAAGRG